MEKLSLQRVAEAVKTNIPREWEEIEIASVCTDTRTIEPGCLFLALEGERFDGHDYIETAFQQGAVAALGHRPIKTERPYLQVQNSRTALLDLARAYREQFSVFLVGVTGSVGKTSTKEMIGAVLSRKYKTLKTEGNLNNEIGLPKTLFRLDRSYRAAVIEMGMSGFGEISRLTRTAKPNLAVITNIGVSHIENLGSRENILKAKLEIMEGLQGDLPLVLNGDNDLLAAAGELVDREILYYGIHNPDVGVRAENICQKGMETQFTISYFGKTAEAAIPVIGEHHVLNALAAFCVGLVADMDEDEIIRGLSQYKPAGMRQNIRVSDGVTLIEDCYNASPDSMKAALDVLSALDVSGQRIAVLGDMLELGEYSQKAHYKVGVLAGESKADVLFCYGPQSENIARGALSQGMTRVQVFQEKEELSRNLRELAKPGDAVLFKASRGIRMEEVIQNTFKGE